MLSFTNLRSKIFVGVLLVLLFASPYALYAEVKIDRGLTDKVWHEWCASLKAELKSGYVFDTRAKKPPGNPSGRTASFIEFDSLIVPVPEEKPKKMSIAHRDSGYATLDLSYESGLQILVSRKKKEVINDVFERFSIDMPGSIMNYLSSKYGSGHELIRAIYKQPVSFLDLRISGFRLTTDDLSCDAKSIEDTLAKIPMVLAAASSDFSASQAGEDVAFWSENSMPGVITRQKEAFSPASERLRVIWSGEFMGDTSTYQVFISFYLDDSETFDFLGYYLANPGAH